MLFNNDWLVVLMYNLLMMFMENILFVFNDDILVMFVNNILMDFLDNGGSNVGSNIGGKFVSFNGLTFIGLLEYCLFVMGDNDWLFVDLLNNDLTFNVGATGNANSTLGVG